MEPIPVTGRSGPVPVWISDRPVTGRPACVLTLKFCFFHVKIYKTSVGSQEYLPDNIQTAFVSSPLHQLSLSGDKSGSRINFRPASSRQTGLYRQTGRLPVDRSVTGRPVSYRQTGRLPIDRYRYRSSKIRTGSISVPLYFRHWRNSRQPLSSNYLT